MKKKLALGIAVFAVVSTMASGMVSAAYISGYDTNINLNVLPGLIKAPSTGSTSFDAQESVHSTITDTTGTTVDHSYIWINVNGISVLAVDPPVAMF